MGIGSSLFLIAAGAILRWAVTDDVKGVDLATVGLVLLLVGLAGLMISLIWMATFARRTAVVPPATRVDPPPPQY